MSAGAGSIFMRALNPVEPFFHRTFQGELIMALNKELLSILACPKCKSDLTLTPAEDGLICTPCNQVYPIKDEIPIMLIEEAIALSDWETGMREKPRPQKTNKGAGNA
jgi:uncharacterized protein